MPDQDGYELIRQVRTLSPERAEIPALALTTYGKEDERRRAMEAVIIRMRLISSMARVSVVGPLEVEEAKSAASNDGSHPQKRGRSRCEQLSSIVIHQSRSQ